MRKERIEAGHVAADEKGRSGVGCTSGWTDGRTEGGVVEHARGARGEGLHTSGAFASSYFCAHPSVRRSRMPPTRRRGAQGCLVRQEGKWEGRGIA